MTRRFLFSSILTVGLAGALISPGGFAQQQQQQQQQQQSSDPYAPPPSSPKPPSAQPDKGCSGQATKGSAGSSKTNSTCPPAAQSQDTPPSTSTQNAGQQPKKSTADDNPFPEDVSAKAASKAKEEEKSNSAPAAASGESSSSDKPEGLDLEGDRDSRISNGAGGVVHDPQLAAHDVHIGEFYLNREDYQGAYVRFKEAIQADPENSDAVFYLAESARRLNHKDEAAQNYQLYLAALPDGPKAKDARKALHDLKVKH
ncbi:MAG TPA: tetratricopeptide repeat protein [Pseudacidobacterium sp.]|jgi:tetratricopeptide (TPR) repeat protein|nr:tetratricopeptide repeat protein [Pseudacidobacterium sp.]